MLVSLNLLSLISKDIKKYSINELEKTFNQLGIEVEEVKQHPKTENLSIVKIIDFKKHENSDHLNIVNVVDIKTNKEYQVVCGANNLKKDFYAIFANIGCKLWNNLEIVERKIRGVNSTGMLCGYSELTNILPSNYRDTGIILFDKNEIEKNGKHDINKLLGLDDIIFDLSIPSNRNDLNCLEILVNELAMVLNINYSLNQNIQLVNNKNQKFNIKLDPELCNFYSLIKFKNEPFELSWYQKEILISSGINIFNSMMDLINFYKLICANPVNVYNGDSFDNNCKLEIKKINNEQYKNKIGIYKDNNLINVIALNKEINNYSDIQNAQSIIIEIANYNNKYIKDNYNLNEIDHNWLFCLKKYSTWISINSFNNYYLFLDNKKIILNDAINNPNNDLSSPTLIKFNLENLNNFLGIKLTIKELKEILIKMQFNFKIESHDIQISIPSYRLDLENEYDIYEELLKYIDINALTPQPIQMNVLNVNNLNAINLENKIANYLNNYSFLETKTYNLVSKDDLNLFNLNQINDFYKLLNPISNQREYYRVNLIHSLLKVIEYNLSYKRNIHSIYEFQSLQIDKNNFNKFLTIIFYNQKYTNNINNISYEWNLINIKWFIKNLLTLTNNFNVEFKILNNKKIPNVNNELFTEIFINNMNIGYIGIVDNIFLKNNYNIEESVSFCQLNFDKLIDLYKNNINLKPVNLFPIITRDININNINEIDLNNKINQIKKLDNIYDCYLKDLYIKDQTKTFTVTIQLVSNNKTLDNDEILKIIDKVNNLLNS